MLKLHAKIKRPTGKKKKQTAHGWVQKFFNFNIGVFHEMTNPIDVCNSANYGTYHCRFVDKTTFNNIEAIKLVENKRESFEPGIDNSVLHEGTVEVERKNNWLTKGNEYRSPKGFNHNFLRRWGVKTTIKLV